MLGVSINEGIKKLSVKRGKLYESVVYDFRKSSCCQPTIYDMLNDAKVSLLKKTMDELPVWISEWFGETE
jgi:hypothetical protein